MPERAPLLPCPVCLSTTMDRLALGPGRRVEVDHCRRCRGIWFDHGEVQRLRALRPDEFWKRVTVQPPTLRPRCHGCHGPLDRAEAACPACGMAAVLDCPACARPMKVETHAGLRLDVCHGCRGVWFDHHELAQIWGASFDRALLERGTDRRSAVAVVGEGVAGGTLDVLFFAPDLAFHGVRAAGHAVGASAEAVSRVPGALASAPEAAASVFGAIGDAAGSVFEVIVDVVGGVFEGFGF